MDAVQSRISLIYTTNNEKNLTPKVCSKKNFQNPISAFFADFAEKYSLLLKLTFYL